MANVNFIVKVKWDKAAATIKQVAELLETADRIGGESDGPEGTRYIQISDTLAMRTARELRHLLTVENDTPRL